MKKEYWIVLIVYIAMQLSSFAGIPAFMFGFRLFGWRQEFVVPVWLITSFTLAFLIILVILRKEMKPGVHSERNTSIGHSIKWAILGVFLALFAQYTAAIIERLIGIELGSKNTQEILTIINAFPLAILVTSIIGPILEEIVFRKIIFGAFYKRFNFFISALISSVVFALVHMEPEHLLIYSAMGFTFAFLYVKTKRILVPIFAHVSMNTMVVLVQSVYKDDIERLMREAEAVQNFIGGFL
ncbi:MULTISPECIES: CPBP family intramembrane glutamic endopeptidase [Neobacillus]|uniref:CPBP family intramembrane metalloprotease n=1 Tax=Neobacillus rhizophilus TaxID=2833579 RepID=A0A942YWZ7_9BACI|nr:MULTISPECIES: type II CAAX endopeptidase family protein [Neobacillus]MBS4216673.1 CPBP family intramembrane metalloprotease [Neobacillus rhizophilus]MBU8920123.1 CPBP family intramembrane metalloprotease [Bacillus sp. FJAT-29953]